MNARSVLLALLCGGGVATLGCSSAEKPVAGELEVRLATPNTDDRALLLRVAGKQTAVTAPAASGYQVHVAPLLADTVRVLVMAPAGQHIPAGAVLRLTVPDTRQVDSYAARALDVASTTYAQRAVSGYTLTVVKP